MFRVEQRVVCVDAFGVERVSHVFSALIQKGKVYTVRGIVPPNVGQPGITALLLEEIIGIYSDVWGHESAWRSNRFRPIVERKTDISIFTEMLTPKKVDA